MTIFLFLYFNLDYNRKIENWNYSLLFKIITKRCRYLLEIQNATISNDIMKFCQFDQLLLLSRLSSLKFVTFHALPSHINTLNLLPNLHSIEFCSLHLNKYGEGGAKDNPPSFLNIDDLADLPKLSVAALNVHDNVKFWLFCQFEHLQKLTVKLGTLISEEKLWMLNRILALEPTIQILHVDNIGFAR